MTSTHSISGSREELDSKGGDDVALHPETITIFDAAAGTGMFSTAVELALRAIGRRGITIGYCEWEACAAASLVARMEAKAIPEAPIWDNLRTLACSVWRGTVDIFCAGYPCQPFSSAGKQLGHRDPRHLWPAVRRAIARIEPSIVFLENVEGHVGKGAGKVIRDLQRLGYRTTAGLFTSAECGASHQRKRIFILGIKELGNTARSEQRDGAVPGVNGERFASGGSGCKLADANIGGSAGQSVPAGRRKKGRDAAADDQRGGAELANTGSTRRKGRRHSEPSGNGKPIGGDRELADSQNQNGRREQQAEGTGGRRSGHSGGSEELAEPTRGKQPELRQPSGSNGQPDGSDSIMGDSASAQRDSARKGAKADKRRRKRRSMSRCNDLPRYAPARNDFAAWARVAELDPARMPSIESALRGVSARMAPWADQLRLSGNGVDPLVAAYAFLSLMCCLEEGVSGMGEIDH